MKPLRHFRSAFALAIITLFSLIFAPLSAYAQDGFGDTELTPQTFEAVDAQNDPATLTVGVPTGWQAQYAEAVLIMSNTEANDLAALAAVQDISELNLAPGEAVIALVGPLPPAFFGGGDAASLLNGLENDLTVGEVIIPETDEARDVAIQFITDPSLGDITAFVIAEANADTVYFGNVVANTQDRAGLTDLALRVMGSIALESGAPESVNETVIPGRGALPDLAPNGFEISGDPETAATITDAAWQTAPTASAFGSTNQIGEFTIELQSTPQEGTRYTLAIRYIPPDIEPGTYDVRVDPSTVQAGFTINTEDSTTGGGLVGTLTINAVQDGLISGTLQAQEDDMFADEGEIMQDVYAIFTDVAIPPVAACVPSGTPEDDPRPIEIVQTVTPDAFLPDTTVSSDALFWAVEAAPAQPDSIMMGADEDRLNLYFSTLAFDDFNFNFADAYTVALTGLPYDLPSAGEVLAVDSQVSQLADGAISTTGASGTVTFTQVGETLAGEFTLTDDAQEITVTGTFSDLPYPELDCTLSSEN